MFNFIPILHVDLWKKLIYLIDGKNIKFEYFEIEHAVIKENFYKIAKAERNKIYDRRL